MINRLIESISISLNDEFGDGYTIYTDSVKQGLKEPCFFIFCLNPEKKPYMGNRDLRKNNFCIQYFPADSNNANEECNAVAERMYSCLEYINVSGNLKRGTKMNYKIVDEVLNFFVDYDLFVYKDIIETTTMQELTKNITAKG